MLRFTQDEWRAVLPHHKMSSGELKGPCPACGGKDRHYVLPTGRAYCRKCCPDGASPEAFERMIEAAGLKGGVRVRARVDAPPQRRTYEHQKFDAPQYARLIKRKVPKEKGWKETPLTLEAALAHLEAGEDHRIGVVPASVGCFVIDIDVTKGATNGSKAPDPEARQREANRRRREYVKIFGKPIVALDSLTTKRAHLWYQIPKDADFAHLPTKAKIMPPPKLPERFAHDEDEFLFSGQQVAQQDFAAWREALDNAKDDPVDMAALLDLLAPPSPTPVEVGLPRPYLPIDIDGFDALLERRGVRLRENVRSHKIEAHNGKQWLDFTPSRQALFQCRAAREFVGGSRKRPKKWQLSRPNWELFVSGTAAERQVDPVKEAILTYTQSEGSPSLEEWPLHLWNFETDERLVRWFGRWAILAAVQRTFEPGCKVDEVPILIGRQGNRKSTFCETLAGDDGLFTSIKFGNHKNMVEAIQGKLIVEIGEMGGLSKAALTDVKSFISNRFDNNIRLAYRRDTEPLPRRCIFIGTANGDAVPNDPTGNRRFVALKITGNRKVSVRDFISKWRESLFAKAVEAYEEGERCEMPEELYRVQADSNERFRQADELLEGALREEIMRRGPREWIQLHPLMGSLRENGIVTNNAAAQKAIRALGFKPARRRLNGPIMRVWVPETDDAKLIMSRQFDESEMQFDDVAEGTGDPEDKGVPF